MNAEINYRGVLQEFEQQQGRAPPTFVTQDWGPQWVVTVKFANMPATTHTVEKADCAKKKDAERIVAKFLYTNARNLASIEPIAWVNAPPPTSVSAPVQPAAMAAPIETKTTAAPPLPVHVPVAHVQNESVGTGTLSAPRTLVYVDVDNAHWVVNHVAAYPHVFFKFYASCGTWPPRPPAGLCNYSWYQLDIPGNDLVDAKIIIDIAQKKKEEEQHGHQPIGIIIISRDKLLYNVSLLLKNVAYVADEASLLRQQLLK
jgi:hypothetical protein